MTKNKYREKPGKIRIAKTTYIQQPKTIKFMREGKEVTIHRKRKRVTRKAYSKKDVGAPGKGRKVVPIVRKGLMTEHAIKMKLIKTDKYGRPTMKVSELSDENIKKLALGLSKKYNPARARRMFAVQAFTFRKRMPDGAKRKFKIGHQAIVDRYEAELAPKAAIKAWKAMSPKERARRMPGG